MVTAVQKVAVWPCKRQVLRVDAQFVAALRQNVVIFRDRAVKHGPDAVTDRPLFTVAVNLFGFGDNAPGIWQFYSVLTNPCSDFAGNFFRDSLRHGLLVVFSVND